MAKKEMSSDDADSPWGVWNSVVKNAMLPLSGNVSQNMFTPWNFLSPTIINVQGKTTNRDLEKTIVSEVGSYGSQLGILNDAVNVLVKKMEGKAAFTEDDKFRILLFKDMMKKVRAVKDAWKPVG